MEKTAKPKVLKKKDVSHAVGRRKTARCTVNLVRGEGENLVNGKKLEEFFTTKSHKANILLPFIKTNTLEMFHFTARTSGGGMSGQADSLKLAIARSIANLSEDYHVILAKESLLTRDPRAKERKKVFFVRARKRPQYSKR